VSSTWLVFHEGQRRRWGGDLRRAFIFAELARRTQAILVDGFQPAAVERGLATAAPRRFRILPGRRPLVASSENLAWASLKALQRRATPVALDVHDDPVAQTASLGVTISPERIAHLGQRMRANLRTFPLLIVPSVSFAELTGIDPARRIVAPNGTESQHIRPQPFPNRPAVGFVSGAAPGRGIESLIEAVRLVRLDLPEVVLLLWLTATGDESARYLQSLRESTAADPWIEIGEAPYARLSDELARATVLTVPHPANPYLDTALPIKLFDSMAAGRPVVVTPRREAAQIVRDHGAGIVAASDAVEDLGEAIARLLSDRALTARLGAAARRVAEEIYDWRVVSARVADEVLARV